MPRFLVSDNRGGLIHHDVREPTDKARRWRIAAKKVGCVSINPIDEHYLVTAHLDRDMRLVILDRVPPKLVIQKMLTHVMKLLVFGMLGR
jgi:hypothetical protein